MQLKNSFTQHFEVAYDIFSCPRQVAENNFSTSAYGMVSFSKQVPNFIIFGYEIILAFEIRVFKV